MNKTTLSLIGLIIFLSIGYVAFQRNDNGDTVSTVEAEYFAHEVSDDVPLARTSEVVELSDGDSYEMVAGIVRQEVGNRSVKRLAYNGQIPGPLLKVDQNSTITLTLTNNLDVPTTLHPHGLRLDNQFDGVPDVTQPPIEVGESFTYELTFPDEGIYWYHPHIREDYTQELGLYGNFLVDPTDENYWNEVDRKEFIILDDFLEGEKFKTDVVTHTLMGRFGDTMLINDQDNYMLEVTQGESARLYITNVANTRTFDFAIPNVQMKLVGGDVGRIEKDTLIDSQIIAPAERYVVEVLFEEVGTFPIEHRGERVGEIIVREGVAPSVDKKTTFNTLRTHDHSYEDVRADFDAYLAQSPDKTLRLDIEMGDELHTTMMGNMDHESMMVKEEGENMMMNMQMDDDAMREHCEVMPEMAGCEQYTDESMKMEHGGMMMQEHGSEDGIEWEDDMGMMNQMSNDENITWRLIDEDTGKENMDIDWRFRQGDMIKVRIFNDPSTMHPMQHPIHFHGQRFVVLSKDGVANNNLQWKDTVLVPQGKTIDILVEMSNPGTWMAHCHIAEHLHAGMMLSFDVAK